MNKFLEFQGNSTLKSVVMLPAQFLFSFVFLVVLLNKVNSDVFKCYQCNSHVNEGCADSNPPEHYLKECHFGVTKAECFANTTGLEIDPECEKVRFECLNIAEGCPTLSGNITISDDSRFCQKSVIIVYGKVTTVQGDVRTDRYQVKPRVTRGCGHIRELEIGAGGACYRRRNGGSFQVGCACKGSGCNKAALERSLQRFQLLILLSSGYSLHFFLKL